MTEYTFDPSQGEPVWYLAHPVAPDERFTYEQNMDHVVKMLGLCFDEGFRCIAPWHTMCLALPDSNPEYRRIGLEVDCAVAYQLGRIILVGHKISSGMKCEVEAVTRRRSPLIGSRHIEKYILDLTALSDSRVRTHLQLWKRTWATHETPLPSGK